MLASTSIEHYEAAASTYYHFRVATTLNDDFAVIGMASKIDRYQRDYAWQKAMKAEEPKHC